MENISSSRQKGREDANSILHILGNGGGTGSGSVDELREAIDILTGGKDDELDEIISSLGA